ncbi:hypothetical protein AAG570_007735 [Ranatra chinensis]|uniref:Reverse transcriptase/retrotransposon-derived protein RNase H-like domain-containing protein n=1 Tax=Ranatra chinensis TaxID=642074 RepID=A0ABD0XUF1_9HEMI
MEGRNSLTKKGAKFMITEDMGEAFEWAKTQLCEDPVLRFPNLSLPFVITTDASQVTVGAVLSQVDSGGGGGTCPVAYASKKLIPTESRYSAIERESSSAWFGPSSTSGLTSGAVTDHKPLVWVEGLRETSARITRWKERLAPYSFQITYNKGRDNVVADCLSRMVNAIDSPSPTLDVNEEVSLEPPGLGMLRRSLRLRRV